MTDALGWKCQVAQFRRFDEGCIRFVCCKFLRLRSDLTKSAEEAIVASLAFLVGMEEVGGGGGGGGPEGAIRMPFLGGGWGAGGIITPWVSK